MRIIDLTTEYHKRSWIKNTIFLVLACELSSSYHGHLFYYHISNSSIFYSLNFVYIIMKHIQNFKKLLLQWCVLYCVITNKSQPRPFSNVFMISKLTCLSPTYKNGQDFIWQTNEHTYQ